MNGLTKNYKHIIFDFDGTINDTSPGIFATFTRVLEDFGIDASKMDLSPHIGPPLKSSYSMLVGNARCNEAIALHRKIYAEINAVEKSFLYDGITDVLEKLYSSGKYDLAVASCKFQPHLLKALSFFRLEKYFSCVYAQTETRMFKADIIAELISDKNWSKADCLMIGDTMHDVDGAHQNGIDVAAVTYGFEKREKLERADVVALLDSPKKILDLML